MILASLCNFPCHILDKRLSQDKKAITEEAFLVTFHSPLRFSLTWHLLTRGWAQRRLLKVESACQSLHVHTFSNCAFKGIFGVLAPAYSDPRTPTSVPLRAYPYQCTLCEIPMQAVYSAGIRGWCFPFILRIPTEPNECCGYAKAVHNPLTFDKCCL